MLEVRGVKSGAVQKLKTTSRNPNGKTSGRSSSKRSHCAVPCAKA
ncbi:hypothetical protein ACFSO0_16640 [Brevibacillus sp. GCM10020057]